MASYTRDKREKYKALTTSQLKSKAKKRGVKNVPKDLGSGRAFKKLESEVGSRALAGYITRKKYGNELTNEMVARGRARK